MSNILPGSVFGRLTVLDEVGKDKHGQRLWLCGCSCGGKTVVTGSNLRGKTRSCGCLKAEIDRTRFVTHGDSGSRTHRAWKSMMARCQTESATGYENYGGRGIRVCSEWHDYSVFLADMGECARGFSIERVDVNGGYSPGNCKWIPVSMQSRNRRSAVFIELDGERLTVSEWGRRLGIGESTIRRRIRLGWSDPRWLLSPVIPGQKTASRQVIQHPVQPPQ